MPQTEDDVRLRFYGTGDYGTYFQLRKAVRLMRNFGANQRELTINDAVELYHVIQFVERDLFPTDVALDERNLLNAKLPALHREVGKFFGCVHEANFATIVVDIDYQYHTDVLELLGRSGAYKRCTPLVVLPALQNAGIHAGELLSCAELVRTYDEDVRRLLLASPRNAEHVLTKHLRVDRDQEIHLPRSFTPSDARSLIASYIDDPSANPNFLKLITDARVDRNSGIDAMLKLKARRAYDAYWREHFETHDGIKSGCEVRVVDTQTEAVSITADGLVLRYSYDREWLASSLDFPTILNNFIHLFHFSNTHMMLKFPSFHAQLTVFERFLVTSGKDNYRSGTVFHQINLAAMLQTAMYAHFLRAHNIELEDVLAWFFSEYLADAFGVRDFRFRPSSPAASYLEKSRHLFSEMESVLRQFALYVENGSLDLELLSMTSESISYRDIPSLVADKYVYSEHNNPDMRRIQHLLFSDQAAMGYVNRQLSESTLAELIAAHQVSYDDFREHQRGNVDFLVHHGIFERIEDGRLRLARRAMFDVLKCLNDFEAASFHHYGEAAQKLIVEMEVKGWVHRRSSLLTSTESSYYNFMLNQSEFSNGPDLRNRYLHGSQADGDDRSVHYETYVQALRLLIGLVIKINDDMELRDAASR